VSKTIGWLLCFLCCMTSIKYADIQIVEVVIVASFAIFLFNRKYKMNITGPKLVIDYFPKILLLYLLMFFGSLLSLRLQFYPPGDFGVLKTPPYASFIRLFQIILASSCVILIGLAIKDKAVRFDDFAKAYIYGAFISSLWSIVSWIGWKFGFELEGAYGEGTVRLRGFFAEGGPFGVFLIGAMLLHYFRRYIIKSISKNSFRLGMALLLVALIGSQSKAAILLSMSFLAYYFYLKKRIGPVLLGLIVIFPALFASDLIDGLQGYYANYDRFAQAAYERPDDANLVMGRIMGSILLPRMVAEHPLLGIGIGNYSLIRNDPSILRGLPTVSGWDLHGLGLLGYCAELGIPLTIFVLWIVAYPIRMTVKNGVWIRMAAAYPLAAALFGVQLNFAYIWIYAGIALAAAAIENRHIAGLQQDIGMTPRRGPTVRHRNPVLGRT
jgi:hypothetical protein